MRTHDLDADADLWKDGLFSRRVTRYVCLSKTQGRPEHVVESLLILPTAQEFPPEGYSLLTNTSDSNAKAFKKKQLCYRLAPFKGPTDSIVDVVILSKLKNPPDGYEHVGDINGMHFCVRKISSLTRNSTPGLAYGILPGANVLYPKLGGGGGSGSPTTSIRSSNGVISPPSYMPSGNNNNSMNSSPAHNPSPYPPQPPSMYNNNGYGGVSSLQKNYSNVGTLTQLCGLDGVPFQLREDLKHAKGRILTGGSSISRRGSAVSVKSQYELDHKVI